MSDKALTGYPSIDRPWMKYYSDTALSAKIPDCTIYEAIKYANQVGLDGGDQGGLGLVFGLQRPEDLDGTVRG